jgi:type IV secretion system protein TrbL
MARGQRWRRRRLGWRRLGWGRCCCCEAAAPAAGGAAGGNEGAAGGGGGGSPSSSGASEGEGGQAVARRAPLLMAMLRPAVRRSGGGAIRAMASRCGGAKAGSLRMLGPTWRWARYDVGKQAVASRMEKFGERVSQTVGGKMADAINQRQEVGA